MGLIVKTTYRVRGGKKASFLADFSVIAPLNGPHVTDLRGRG